MPTDQEREEAMKRSVGVTTDAPQPAGHYSQAVRIGQVIWTAGQGGYDPETRRLVAADVEGQARQSLNNIRAALASCGANLVDVVRVGVFLADVDQRDSMNRVFKEYWPTDPPARTTVGGALPGGMLVEIDAMAIVDS